MIRDIHEHDAFIQINEEWHRLTDDTPVGAAWRGLPYEQKLAWLVRNFTMATERALELAGGYLDAEQYYQYLDKSNNLEWLHTLPIRAQFMIHNAGAAYVGLALVEHR